MGTLLRSLKTAVQGRIFDAEEGVRGRGHHPADVRCRHRLRPAVHGRRQAALTNAIPAIRAMRDDPVAVLTAV